MAYNNTTPHLPPVAGTPTGEWSQEAVSALHNPASATVRQTGASANPADADPSQTANPVVFDPAANVHAAQHPAAIDTAAKGPLASALGATAETPGPAVPGAFPRTLSDAGKPPAGDVAAGYLDTLKDNLGQAAQSAVHYLPENVQERVAPYLRASLLLSFVRICRLSQTVQPRAPV